MTQKTEAMVLREAAAILERDGWVQGVMHLEGKGHCTLGAIHEAMGQPELVDISRAVRSKDWWTPARYELLALDMRLSARIGTDAKVSAWNDAPERTLEEVLALLHAAADDAAREQLALVPAREAVGV